MSESENLPKKATTHKGRKILAERAAKLEEGLRKTIFLRSTKTSETISNLLHEILSLKRSNSLLLQKRLNIKPMESSSEIENMCKKNDCPLFIFGSNSKKRKDNLVIGRIYNDQILDIVEFGVENFKSQKELISKFDIPLFARPCIFFEGDLFEYDANYMRIKNLFLDFFSENIVVTSVNLLSSFTHLICFTISKEGLIHFRLYKINIDKLKTDKEKQVLEEIYPSFELSLRRQKLATDDLFKTACKQPKIQKKKEDKNVKRDKLGDKRGRIFVEKQDIDALGLKKRKKLKTEKSKSKPKKDKQPKDKETPEIPQE